MSFEKTRSKLNRHTSSTAFRKVSSDTSQYSAVVPIWRCPISFWIVLIPTPFALSLVAKVRRPECDEVRIPAASYISLNSIDRLTFEKARPFRCDAIRGASGLGRGRFFKLVSISDLTRLDRTTVRPFEPLV